MSQFDPDPTPKDGTMWGSPGPLSRGPQGPPGPPGEGSLSESRFIEEPTDKDYVVVIAAPAAGSIEKLTIGTVSGSCTATVKINNTPVTGLTNLSVIDDILGFTPTAGNTFNENASIVVTISNSSAPTDLAFTLKIGA